MKPTFRDYLIDPGMDQDSYYSNKPHFPSWVIEIARAINNLHNPNVDLPLHNDSNMLADIQHLVDTDHMDHNNPEQVAGEYLKQRELNHKELSQELLGM